MKAIQIVLICALVFGAVVAPVQSVVAAPAVQTATPITGIVEDVIVVAGASTVSVVLMVGGVSQTVQVSVADAVTLGLVSVDPVTGAVTVNETAQGSEVTIQPEMILPPAEVVNQHPVAEAVAEFFDLDYETVMGFHEDGNGFGVIVQACYLSYQLTGDASLCGDILAAKKSGDYSAFTLPGGTTVTNWGQFKKAVTEIKNPHNNLGGIKSGHADKPGEVSLTGKSKGKSDKSKGNDAAAKNDKDKNDKSNGNSNKDKEKGNKNK